MKWLFAKWRALGDSVLLSAQVEELTKVLPGVELHLWLPESHLGLYEADRRVGRLWPYRGLNLGQLWALRRERFDAVFGFHASTRMAWALRAVGAPVRGIHVHHHHRPNLFSTLSVAGKGQVWPATLRDAATWRAALPPHFGNSLATGGIPPQPRLQKLGEKEGNLRRLLVGWGASVETKRWPREYWRDLLDRVFVRWPELRLSVLLGPEDVFDLELSARHQTRVDLWRSKSLVELRQIIPGALGFVGHDSGPKHLCAALGVPTLTLFGPQDPWEWHPYDVSIHPYLRVEGLTCRNSQMEGQPPWCGRRVCSVESPEAHRCMRDLSVDSVERALQKLIAASPSAKLLS